MTSPQGEPVGAVYGFVRDLFTLLEKHQPDYLFCAFDLPGPTFRAEIYGEYKANRAEMPDDLRPQIQSAREVLDAMGALPLAVPGFEADDILATVARQVERQGGNCVIVTADKDCRQLISANVSLFNLRKQAFYTAENLLADWGIRPDQVVDFQSLVGDATDNVPGVPLIGPKTATDLLNKYETLENVFEHVSEIKGKKGENLAAGKEIALMSRSLVKLRDDVPLEIDWADNAGRGVIYRGRNDEKLRELFLRFGFKSLLSKIDTNGVGDALSLNDEHRSSRTEQPTFFDTQEAKPKSFKKPTYHLVDDEEKFNMFFEALKKQTEFSFDTETAPMDARFEATMPRYTVLVGMSFAWSNDEAWYLPLRGPLGAEVLKEKSTMERLRPVLEDESIGKIGQNLKYDMVVLRQFGILLRGLSFDTMIADYLLHAGEMNHSLDDISERLQGHRMIPIADLIGTGKKQKRMDEVPTEAVCEYAGEDALVVWRLYPLLKESLSESPELQKLLQKIELPLVAVLAEMETNGVSIDTASLQKLNVRFGTKLRELEAEIYEQAGHPFNVASPKQLAAVLFDELGLRSVKKTKTGLSTDMEVLEELAHEHPLPAKIVEHRQLSKLKGTYVEALPELIHPKTLRIHTSFNQVATATGRLSSSHPNLQNIPVRSSEGREIRAAFRPGKGFDLLLSCDYSQIELRVLAHFSGDEKLTESFRNSEDIHRRVAAEVFCVAPEEVTSNMRRTAKAVNFGVIYGQTAFGLAKSIGIPQNEAQKFIDDYFSKYARIKNYLDSILDDAVSNGFVATLFGRRRYFRDGTLREGAVRRERKGGLNQAERMAINTVIQGSAADLMKQAMIDLQNTLPPDMNAKLLLQIHDELVFEVTKSDAEKLRRIVTETMMLNQPLNVPLVVDADLVTCWE